MPDVFAHIIFANIIVEQIDITTDKWLLNFGSQGPDILGFIYPDLSIQMHYRYEIMLNNLSLYNELISLYLGYHTHYALDNLLHPIIKASSPTLKIHLLIESCLDQIIAKTFWNKNIKDLSIADYIPAEIPVYAGNQLNAIIDSTFSFKLKENFWQSALQHYFDIYRKAVKGESNIITYPENPYKVLDDILGQQGTKILLDAFEHAIETEYRALKSDIRHARAKR